MGLLDKLFGKRQEKKDIQKLLAERDFLGLIAALDDDDLKPKATDALVTLGNLAVEPILHSLSEWNKRIFSRLQERCSSCGGANTIEAGHCMNNARFRIEVLKYIPDPRSISVLLDALADGATGAEVSQKNKDMFKEQEEKVLEKFRQGGYDPDLDVETMRVEHLRAHLFRPALQAEWMAKAALDGLVAIGKPAIQPVIAALNDRRPYVRYALASVLTHIGGPDAKAALENMLNDPDEYVRKKIGKSLG